MPDKAAVITTIDDKRFGYYCRTCNNGLCLKGYRFWNNHFIFDIDKNGWSGPISHALLSFAYSFKAQQCFLLNARNEKTRYLIA